MIDIWLIRHGMTEGNKFGRYIGITDDPLCTEGKEALFSVSYPMPERLFTSPLTRCRETAEILFAGKEAQVVMNLAECDFGEFENKNYQELSETPSYQKWVDSDGKLPFPGGESPEGFKLRSIEAFVEVVDICLENGTNTAALVVHGGTIMSVMETFAQEKREFYQWHVKNGCGYHVRLNRASWQSGVHQLELKEIL